MYRPGCKIGEGGPSETLTHLLIYGIEKKVDSCAEDCEQMADGTLVLNIP